MITGKFIVFEGIDTQVLNEQADRMAAWLRQQQGLTVVRTQEPSGGPIGTQLGLVHDGRLQVDDLTLAAMELADRLDHLHRKEDGVFVELQNGRYVLCVRYVLSAYVYARAMASFAWVYAINQLCPWPDLMIFIDTPVEQALHAWVEQEGCDSQTLEARRAEVHAIRDRYLHIISVCETRGQAVAVVSGGQSPAMIHQACQNFVADLG